MNTLDRVDVVNGCYSGGRQKIGVYQDRSGLRMQASGGGQFMWSPTPGIRITGTTFGAKLKDANGIRASLIGPRSAGGQTELDEGQPHDGQLRTMRWSGSTLNPALVVARLQCTRPDGCDNDPGGPKAFFEVFDLDIQADDVAPPAIAASGELWERSHLGGWFRGPVGFRIDATDQGSGISRGEIVVNGLSVDLESVLCPGDRGAYATAFTPCPDNVARAGSFDTSESPFREGANEYRFCATDYAIPREIANRTCTEQQVLMVDNTPPAQPSGLEVLGGSEWRAANGFHFRWQTPAGQASPIVSAEYRVINLADGEQVDQGSVTGPEPESAGPVELPAAGEYRVEFRLRDEAGNLGNAASVVVRFDDSPPGDVAPEEPAGWISDDELPLRQPIERAAAGGPSGVGGYAVAVSSAGPARPCAAEVCEPSELAVAGGPDSRIAPVGYLPEGSHWVSAVAASGARLSSLRPGSTLVRVDRSDPETTVSGVPAGWVSRPVTVIAKSADELSGMAADPGRDDGNPVTVIAPEGQSPYVSPGDESRFTIATEGVTRVSYWAMDLAGNVNDGRLGPAGERHRPPGTTTVRIDSTPPQLSFVAQENPAVPEMVTALAEDGLSGVESGRIEIRRIGGSGPFRRLDTKLSGDRLGARVPSDDLKSGVYELRAWAVDRAGNTGTTVSREDGSAMVLTLPLKRPVSVSLRHLGRKAKAKRITVSGSKTATLTGRVRYSGGPGIAGARLSVEQRFASGSRRGLIRRRVVCDGTGRFVFRLRRGPSRSIRVTYGGTDLTARAVSRKLGLSVHGGISLRLSPGVLRNGGRTTMRGSVASRGAILPAGGKLVAIQYYDPARSRWRPVEVLRADRKGRFRYSYRFRTITSAQRILFRAVSLPEAGWPYLPSTSRPGSVIVYPRGSR